MDESNVGAAPSTTTIKVIVRHGTKCKREHPGLPSDYKDCNCRKSIYIYENGEDQTIAAKTRSWSEAEKLAQRERDKRDPDKQELAELKRQLAAKKETETATATPTKNLTIVDSTERWIAIPKNIKDASVSVRRVAANRIQAWAKDNQIETVDGLTTDRLDKWRGEWNIDAKEPYNRIGLTTQHHFQGYLQSYTRYLVYLGYLDKDPAAGLPPINASRERTHPLSPEQFEDLLTAIVTCCADQTGVLHNLAAELDALFSLQRWAGLRILDALMFRRSGLVGNTINLTTLKTGASIKNRRIPDDVAAKLNALSVTRPGFRKEYFFWPEGICADPQSLESHWQKYISTLNAYLHFIDEEGNPMRFRSHMLRDTYAVQLLLAGVPLEKVSKLLTHESVATTERYYARWVKARLEDLENESVAAIRRMGKIVTTEVGDAQTDTVDDLIQQFFAGLARTGQCSGTNVDELTTAIKASLNLELPKIGAFCSA